MTKTGCAVQCGCGRHLIDIDGEKVVQYQGRWWQLRCLFLKVDRRMPVILKKFSDMEHALTAEIDKARKMRLKFIQMKKFLRSIPCSGCGYPAGNRFVVRGTDVFCGSCKVQGEMK